MIWRPSVALPTLCSAANRSSRSKSGISSGIVTVRVEPPANVTARCRRVYARSNRMHCTPFPVFGTTPVIRSGSTSPWERTVCHCCTKRVGRLAAGNSAKLSPFLLQMRMNVRVEECRRRAAECAEKALCQPDPEIRQIFAELAEQWRALAEQTEFLEQFH
jgi:hypothetical protein